MVGAQTDTRNLPVLNVYFFLGGRAPT